MSNNLKDLNSVLTLIGKKKLTKNEKFIFDNYKDDPDFYFRKTEQGGLAATRIGYKMQKI